MTGSVKAQLRERWGKFSPAARTGISVAALFGGMMVIAAFILPSNKNDAQITTAHQQRISETNLVLPQRKDTSLEGLAAGQEAIKVDQQKATQSQAAKDIQIEELKKQLAEMAGKKPEDQPQEIMRELARISGRLDDFEKGKGVPNLADALPSPDKTRPDNDPLSAPDLDIAPTQQAVSAKPKIPKISVIGKIHPNEKQDNEKQNVVDESKPIPYLPPGSMFEGVLINGMDAPTSGVTEKNPAPATVRIKTDAILPNRNDFDVKECFVVISGFGVLSTERAQLRTETLSCIKENGEVIEAKLEGYIVGEDGKVGLRGRLISKQGSVIAKTLVAGLLGGFASTMVPSPVPQMNIAPGLTQQYQSPNFGAAAQAGMSKGLADSTRMLSQFYLDMAKDMFPVIEIDAGRRVTIILVRGVELLPTK